MPIRANWKQGRAAIRVCARRRENTPSTSDQLPRVLAEFQTKLETIENSDETTESGSAGRRAREERLSRNGAQTCRRRAKPPARRLEAAVAAELKPLKLGHAKFHVSLEPLSDESAAGLERVSFEVATVEGAPFGPLAKIASGGELARFSLALKVALAEASPPAALVFDEVDRGVGGAVADAVGERLQRLAKTHADPARHAFAAGRGARRAAFPHHALGRQDARRHAGRRRTLRRNRAHAVRRRHHRRGPRAARSPACSRKGARMPRTPSPRKRKRA